MKRITMLALLLVCAFGYSQSATASEGINNPQSTNQNETNSLATSPETVANISDCINATIEINQNVNNSCMANFSATGLAQSYVPTQPEAAGAGIKLRDPATEGLNLTLSLWNGLPNAGGSMLASKTTTTATSASWLDVFWDTTVSVTVGATYYIVIEGDSALPCIAGSANDPYPDGNVFANDYDPFPDFDYTFRTYSCDGSGSGCDSNIASNAFEGGRGCSANENWTAANDLIIPAGSEATLNTIIPHIYMNPGATVLSVDVIVYGDAADLPDDGNVIDTQLGVVPTSQIVVGQSSSGHDVSQVTLNLSPVSLPGDAGSDTTYWVSIQVTTSDGDRAFWEYNTADAIGNPLAFNDTTGWEILEAAQDGVYAFIVDCSPLSVSENALDGFSYYPNPADNVITLNTKDTIENVAIYSILGQKVMDQTIGNVTAELNISSLSTGTYIMKVSVNGEIGTYKVIKR